METKLAKIQLTSQNNPKAVFNSVYHMINKELLRECHHRLDGNKATGIDNITKDEYGKHLDDNLDSLIQRLKHHGYKPRASLRAYIPKANGKKRPLGISTYEDKLVQYGLKCVIEAVFEPRFLDNMYGFRPNKNCHDAIKSLGKIIERGKISYVLDADIKGFFNNINHEWLIKFVEVHIKDPNIIRLMKKVLKAGVSENGEVIETETGVEQGSLCSPVLANIYMHYVLNLWFYKAIKPKLKGQGELVIYADDFVGCFQYKSDAEMFQNALRDRLGRFGLELENEKTRLISFGKYADIECKRKGTSKPQTFDFLGFTHICGRNRNGKFRIKRKTCRKKQNLKLKEMNLWIRNNRNEKLPILIKEINLKLVGYYRYFGITDNISMLNNYLHTTSKLLYKWLNRRSQRRSYTSTAFNQMLKVYPLAKPKIYVNVYQ